MKKLTPEEFNSQIRPMSRAQLLAYIEQVVVIRPAGRKPAEEPALTPYERLKRHRERKRQQGV